MASHQIERALIRILIAAALASAIFACTVVPVPRNAKGDSALPAVALEQPGLYRLEIALVVFYGILLLATPAFSGLIRGRLPTEISTRGAKFADGLDQSVEDVHGSIDKLEKKTTYLMEELELANQSINQLMRCSGDGTQPAVDSGR